MRQAPWWVLPVLSWFFISWALLFAHPIAFAMFVEKRGARTSFLTWHNFSALWRGYKQWCRQHNEALDLSWLRRQRFLLLHAVVSTLVCALALIAAMAD